MTTAETTDAVLRSLLAQRPRGAQAQLARDLNVRPQTVTKWLNGDVSLPSRRWLDVEEALGVEPLTIARRTGFLEYLPELANLSGDQLRQTWYRLTAMTTAESEAERQADALRWQRAVRDRLEAVRRAIGDHYSFASELVLNHLEVGLLDAIVMQCRLFELTVDPVTGQLDSNTTRALRTLSAALAEPLDITSPVAFADLGSIKLLAVARIRAVAAEIQRHSVAVPALQPEAPVELGTVAARRRAPAAKGRTRRGD